MNILSRTIRRIAGIALLSGLTTSVSAAESLLEIAPLGSGVVLSWPAMTQSHVLESSSSLTGTAWTTVPLIPVVEGSRKHVTVEVAAGSRYYRLRYPAGTATDEPDGAFTDTNGDGIDGDLRAAVFVSVRGEDGTGRGLAPDAPCRTIPFAMALAAASGRTQVCVQAGVYPGVVSLANGIRLCGGYDGNWQRAAADAPGHTAQLTGGVQDGEFMTLRAADLTVPATVADMEIRGPNATGTGGTGRGRSSQTVWIRSSQVTLERLRIVAGDGADGGAGISGISASQVPAENGGAGERAGHTDDNGICDDDSNGNGGGRGSNPYSSGRNPRGGYGGVGGTADTRCGPGTPETFPESGRKGDNAASAAGGFGEGGPGGPADTAIPGSPGADGNIIDGSGGAGGSGGITSGGFWSALDGLTGGIGDNGMGGGGGGGSGGNNTGWDTYGAGAGGGGAGGLRAPASGSGGRGAGGSFGIFIAGTGSRVSVSGCRLTGGSGGRGGAGGDGGLGQPGGSGGAGGEARYGAPAGGNGGNGSRGGHSGGGGGGAGGASIGIAWQAGSSVTLTDNTFVPGSGGPGGSGGSSPTVPGFQGIAGAAVATLPDFTVAP